MLACLPVCHRRAQHDVAEQTYRRLLAVGWWAQFIHRKAQHVGGSCLAEIFLVVRAHRAFVHQQDRELRQGMDPELVESERGKPDQSRIVNLDAGLVADVDAHIRAPDRARITTAIAYRPGRSGGAGTAGSARTASAGFASNLS